MLYFNYKNIISPSLSIGYIRKLFIIIQRIEKRGIITLRGTRLERLKVSETIWNYSGAEIKLSDDEQVVHYNKFPMKYTSGVKLQKFINKHKVSHQISGLHFNQLGDLSF